MRFFIPGVLFLAAAGPLKKTQFPGTLRAGQAVIGVGDLDAGPV
jgi:hypothetical protein